MTIEQMDALQVVIDMTYDKRDESKETYDYYQELLVMLLRMESEE